MTVIVLGRMLVMGVEKRRRQELAWLQKAGWSLTLQTQTRGGGFRFFFFFFVYSSLFGKDAPYMELA